MVACDAVARLDIAKAGRGPGLDRLSLNGACEVDDSGWGDPGHEVSICRSTCIGFIRAQQIGQATRPSAMLPH